jgi:hypothetical protein
MTTEADIARTVGREDDKPWPAYAWPGGYAIFYLADDMEYICADCMGTQAEIHFDEPDDGWRIVAAGAFGATDDYPDTDALCAHCNKVICEGDPDAE